MGLVFFLKKDCTVFSFLTHLNASLWGQTESAPFCGISLDDIYPCRHFPFPADYNLKQKWQVKGPNCSWLVTCLRAPLIKAKTQINHHHHTGKTGVTRTSPTPWHLFKFCVQRVCFIWKCSIMQSHSWNLGLNSWKTVLTNSFIICTELG